ncbi:MAG TPA: hypothetical protein VGD65_24580 [Chryseosolibacter sp.]
MVVRSMLSAALVIAGLDVMAQQFEFGDPKKLPGAINSAAEEAMPLLSRDGKKLFFTRALSEQNEGGVYGGQDIWVSDAVNGQWAKASNKLSINTKDNNTVVGVDRDGQTLFFTDGAHGRRMNGIYMTRLQGSKFTKPELIPIPGIDNLDFIGFYVSPDRDVIFISMKASDSRGEEDLYYSTKALDGAWSVPKNLGATINTSGFEIAPFLSPDKKRLYFSSNGHSGMGDADIFYSDRVYESWETWSVPVNLGPNVNSKNFDSYFSIYGDSLAFFSSNREGKYADLYQVSVGELKTILERGQHYLTQDEWNTVIGKNVWANFAFPHNSTILSAAQKELLFYIVNKVMLEREYQFHLVVKEEEGSTFSQERLGAIQSHLKQLGLDAGRIRVDQIFDIEKTQRGVIELKLFK